MAADEEQIDEQPKEPRLTRRGLIAAAGAASVVASGTGQLDLAVAAATPKPPPRPRTPNEALRALLDGNKRYVSGHIQSLDYNQLGERIAETQKPIAAIVTCADSRISPPVIFDLGIGNVFVSRVAGNSLDSGTLGSTEYAVAVLGVLLVMVLGHSDCGAVKAGIAVANGEKSYPKSRYGAIGEIVDAVAGPVSSLPPAQRTLDRSIAKNAQAQAQRFAAAEPIIAPAVAANKLLVVAGVYDIASGRVSLVDETV